MGTDKGKERAKRWLILVENGYRGAEEKDLGTDKARVMENCPRSCEEEGTGPLWGKGDAPW